MAFALLFILLLAGGATGCTVGSGKVGEDARCNHDDTPYTICGCFYPGHIEVAEDGRIVCRLWDGKDGSR